MIALIWPRPVARVALAGLRRRYARFSAKKLRRNGCSSKNYWFVRRKCAVKSTCFASCMQIVSRGHLDATLAKRCGQGDLGLFQILLYRCPRLRNAMAQWFALNNHLQHFNELQLPLGNAQGNQQMARATKTVEFFKFAAFQMFIDRNFFFQLKKK